MKMLWVLLGFAGCGVAAAQSLPADDAVRVAEFYRLAPQMEDGIWAGWSKVASPVMLLTADAEFLTHYPTVPDGFHAAGDGYLVGARQFPPNLEATFPPFEKGPAVIVIGEPPSTASKTSTPWEVVMMHEHFHQMQYAQPGYYEAVAGLGLQRGDKTGMWMLNYAFPYADKDVVARFGALRDQLLVTVKAPEGAAFRAEATKYLAMRAEFFGKLSADDAKYFKFQLWQEGIARYTQIAAAEAAKSYEPTAAYRKLPAYEPFDGEASQLRAKTMEELRTIEIAKAERGAVYSFGAVEGLLLDRLNPGWKGEYFKHLLSTDALFVQK